MNDPVEIKGKRETAARARRLAGGLGSNDRQYLLDIAAQLEAQANAMEVGMDNSTSGESAEGHLRLSLPSVAGKNVLIVEDSYLYADLLRTGFLAAGAKTVVAVPSVSSAFAALAIQSFSFVTLDIDLGGETSFSVADELAARCIPFIFLSSSPRSVLPQMHHDKGLLDKLDFKQIAETIAALSPRAQEL